MYATKRKLEVLHRKRRLQARTDLPRSNAARPVFGARKARLALLAAEEKASKAAAPPVDEEKPIGLSDASVS